MSAASTFTASVISQANSLLSARFPSRTATVVFTSSLENHSRYRALGAVATRPTSVEISKYQIVLWSAVLLVLALGGAVYSLVFMDLGRDPVLYNQFKNDESKRD